MPAKQPWLVLRFVCMCLSPVHATVRGFLRSLPGTREARLDASIVQLPLNLHSVARPRTKLLPLRAEESGDIFESSGPTRSSRTHLGDSPSQGAREKIEHYVTAWKVSAETINAGFDLWDSDGCRGKDDAENDQLAFLYAKGVKAEEESEDRVREFERILNPSMLKASKVAQRCQRRSERLKRLLELDYVMQDKTKLADGVQSFPEFIRTCPAWEEKDTFVFHLSFPGSPHALIQRQQKSGLCYLTGPAVTQHYAICKARGGQDAVPSIDIKGFIRIKLSPKEMEDHIFEDDGGSSLDILKRILHRDTKFRSLFPHEVDVTILKELGPCLVSRFSVHADFIEASKSSYFGMPSGEVQGMHAMVLIGIRGEGDNRVFLLQNWWNHSQFVEVDLQYFQACVDKILPSLIFVETPQTSIPDDFPTSSDFYDECTGVDKGESERFYFERV